MVDNVERDNWIDRYMEKESETEQKENSLLNTDPEWSAYLQTH